MLEKQILLLKLVGFGFGMMFNSMGHALSAKLRKILSGKPSPALKGEPERNIVVVGASFAGWLAAHDIAAGLPSGSGYRVIVVEPHSHFHFTWVFPRFSVVSSFEHEAFIPYSSFLPADKATWITDRVVSISPDSIQLASSLTPLPYAYLVIATGSGSAATLPSRVPVDGKSDGITALNAMQGRVARADNVVVVGGGAAGVEFAGDVKAKYPEKKVTLVHSRDAVMNRFGPELQTAALKGLQDVGVDVILNERVVDEADDHATLTSGHRVKCDLLVHCAGTAPNSSLLATLSPSSITPTGHIRVLPTLQVADPALPHVYACGDVIDAGIPCPNSRAAMMQGMIAGANVVLAAHGQPPAREYRHHWAERSITLTLGLVDSISHFGNGKTELLFRHKEKKLDLMCDRSWQHWSAKPFQDPAWKAEARGDSENDSKV